MVEKGTALNAGEQIRWQVFEPGDANTRFIGSGKNLTSSTPIVYIIMGCGHRDTIWFYHCPLDKAVDRGRVTPIGRCGTMVNESHNSALTHRVSLSKPDKTQSHNHDGGNL